MRGSGWGILHNWAVGKLNSVGSWCTKLSNYMGGWCPRKLNSMGGWVKKRCRLPPLGVFSGIALTYGSLKKVESIAECSPWSFLLYFRPALR